ncbi:multidrug effflux MFS transporter [Klebsiella michiganensis]|uniref:multidrug effflux MFS transporter n=1 Tax=Klebsiella michiganensis TaxID=1134687 RepID=UPI003DA91537
MESYKSHISPITALQIKTLIFSIPFLMGLGVDLYVPSLPAISHSFNTQQSTVQLSIATYMFGYGIGQFFLGIISDSLGRRLILKYCSIIFLLSSLFCIALVPSIYWLNLWRFIQGLSIAGLAVVARAMIVDVFSGSDLFKFTNYFGLSWSLGPIIGPNIGGYLQHYFDWKANFVFFAIYGVFLALISFINLPETNKKLKPLNKSFNVYNIKKVTLDIPFLIYCFIGGIGYGVIVLFNVVGPFLLQQKYLMTPIEYGHYALALGFAYFSGSLTNKKLVNKIKSISVLNIGLIFCSALSVLFFILTTYIASSYYLIILGLFFIFFFIGFIVPNTLANSMKLFPSRAGTASSVFGTLTGVIVSVVSSFGSLTVSLAPNSLFLNYIFYFIVSFCLCLLIQFNVFTTSGDNDE